MEKVQQRLTWKVGCTAGNHTTRSSLSQPRNTTQVATMTEAHCGIHEGLFARDEYMRLTMPMEETREEVTEGLTWPLMIGQTPQKEVHDIARRGCGIAVDEYK